jgi:hypothetical protein
MLIDDTRQKAEILNKQYHSVFTPECENEELLLASNLWVPHLLIKMY